MTNRTASELRTAAVLDFAHALVTAAHHRLLHGRDHHHTTAALQAVATALVAADRHDVELPLQLQFDDDAMHHDAQSLVAPSLQAKALLRALGEREIATLAFHRGLDAEELNRLFDLLLLDQNRVALARQHRERSLQAFAVRNVRVTSRSPADPGDRQLPVDAAAKAVDLRLYQNLADTLHQGNAAALRSARIAVDRAQTAIEQTLLQLDQSPSGLLSLAAQDNVDRFTVGHSVRVALLALQVARAAGAGREQLVEVGTAALLHDIGKSKVPQEILWKRGKLDEGEWVWMAQHPRLGADILLEQPDLYPSAVGAAFCHHLRADGGGYPRTTVPLLQSGMSRLVRVCDVFEALTAVRPYKKALTPLEAYAVMRRHESDFDQRWFQLFVRTLGVFPQGSRVRLDDGAMAVVLRQGENPAAPIVRLLTGPGGGVLAAGAADVVTIGARVDGAVRTMQSVYTRDRSVAVPEGGWDTVEFLTQTAHGACLRRDCGEP